MAVALAPPPVKEFDPTTQQKLSDWTYQLWQIVAANTLALTAITFTPGTPFGTTTIAGNLVVTNNVTVTGVVTDAQTYTRNLGIYSGLLAE